MVFTHKFCRRPYLLLFYFIFCARLTRKLRLFTQAMPRVLGSLIVGYAPLWFEEETWTFPFHMSWTAILGSVWVLLVVSYLYFAVEVSGKVKLRSEAIQKATAVFLIAAAQAYCIGLLITDFSARHFTRAMPFARDEPYKLCQELLSEEWVKFVPSPLSPLGPTTPDRCQSGLQGYDFWLLPKLLVFWFGVAMFVAVFLHMLWEKEGILERVSGAAGGD